MIKNKTNKLLILFFIILMLFSSGCNSKYKTIEDCILEEITLWAKSEELDVNIDKNKDIETLSLTLKIVENATKENFMVVEVSFYFLDVEENVFQSDLILFIQYEPANTFGNKFENLFGSKYPLQTTVNNCNVELYCKSLIKF